MSVTYFLKLKQKKKMEQGFIYRLTECLRLQGPLEFVWSNHLLKAGSSRAGCMELCPDGFWILSVSRDEGSIASLGDLYLYWTTLTLRILMIKWNCLCFSLCLLPLVLSLGTPRKVWLPLLYSLFFVTKACFWLMVNLLSN